MTQDNCETLIRRWTAIKKTSAIVAACGILLGGACTAMAMIAAFTDAAEGRQTIPVDSLASSIESSFSFGMWLSPLVVGFAILWFVSRAKLRTLYRSRS